MQSRLMSLIEALANVVVGFWLAVIAQMLVIPLFGLSVSFGQNLAIATLFTGVSLIVSVGSGLRRGFRFPFDADRIRRRRSASPVVTSSRAVARPAG